jgi:type I restriction enzyme M protein
MGDQDHIRENLFAYIQAFSPSVRDIFERFDFYTQIERLASVQTSGAWSLTNSSR